jgi:hypothetical protein
VYRGEVASGGLILELGYRIKGEGYYVFGHFEGISKLRSMKKSNVQL